MKRLWNKIAATGMALTLAVGLSACDLLGGSGMSTKDATYYVQGYIDEVYMGKYDKNFLEFMDITENEAEEIYQEGLEAETDFFISYFGLDKDVDDNTMEVPETLRTQIRDIYKELYSKSKYTVGEASKMEDGSYSVPIKVEPMDVIKNMEEGINDYLDQFITTYTEEERNAMTDEEFNAYVDEISDFYNNQYGQKIVEFFQQHASNVGHLGEKSTVIQVESTTEGDTTTWSLNKDNTSLFDEYVIYYPSYSNYVVN